MTFAMRTARWVLVWSVALLGLSRTSTATVARPVGTGVIQGEAWSTDRTSEATLRTDETTAQFVGVPAGLRVPLSEPERALVLDAADGVFDTHRLLVAGLIASGVTDSAMLDRYVEQFERLANRLRCSVAADADEQTKAVETLHFLHAEVLQGSYGREITTLTAALDQGDYNCVSSAVLFNCLARSVGLRVQGVRMPGHAFSVVQTSDGAEIEVQTTCADWLDRSAEARRLPAGTEIGHGPRHVLSDPQLVAMIYFNRGVTAIRSKRYEEAVAQNFKAIWLDRHFDKARHNLLATLDRWETDYCEQGRYDDAMRVLGYALRIAPTHETLHTKYANLCHDYVVHLLERQQYEEVLAVLAEAGKLLGHDPWIEQARRIVLRGGVVNDESATSARSDIAHPHSGQHEQPL